jgi:PTH1 family peptidyl-tRNA hydrolase
MKLIIGLGNPDEKYKDTRHNIGHQIVDKIANNAKWVKKDKYRAQIFVSHNIVFAKPLTFMNDSGSAVNNLLRFFKLKPENLLVAHDDIDLPLGTYKLQFNRGAAGHHGVESVIKSVGTKEFWRLRIGTMGLEGKKITDGAKFVLSKFTLSEKRIINDVLDKLVKVVQDWSKNS